MRPVFATVWIHRSEASGILVETYSNEDAYKLSCEFVQGMEGAKNYTWDYLVFPDATEEGRCFHSSQTPSIQISIHPGSYTPAPFWNDRGTVRVTDYEALELGEKGEPEGFEPEESSAVWTKERRSHEALDEELTDYFRLGEFELKEVHEELFKYASMFHEEKLMTLMKLNDLYTLKGVLNLVKDIYNKMTSEEQARTDNQTVEMHKYFWSHGI
jgi:hypothetical protein